MRINRCDIPDRDDGLTVRDDNNVNINGVKIVQINDPDRLGQIVVVAAVNIVPAIKLCTVGGFDFFGIRERCSREGRSEGQRPQRNPVATQAIQNHGTERPFTPPDSAGNRACAPWSLSPRQ